MKEFLLKTLFGIQKTLRVYHKTLTHIEGGLGSQILGVMSLYNNLEKFGKEKAKCDLSYFDEPRQSNLWPWGLDKFGLALEDLRVYESRKLTNLLKAKKDFPSDDDLAQNYWLNCRKKYLSKFPPGGGIVKQFLADHSITEKFDTYGAAHIRRGDYLSVASKVISLNQCLTFLLSIEKSIPNHLFFVSDSKFSIEEKKHLRDQLGNKRYVIFLDDPNHDPFTIHCLLRNADLLVTSNSTFSFSAGLLGKEGQVVFSPSEFHSGSDSEKYNKSFRSVASFSSWDLNELKGRI